MLGSGFHRVVSPVDVIRGRWNFGAPISSHDMRCHEKPSAASWQTTIRRGGGNGCRFDPFLMSETKKIEGNCWIRPGASCSLLFGGEVAGWVEGGRDVAQAEGAEGEREGERRVSPRRMPQSRENLGKGNAHPHFTRWNFPAHRADPRSCVRARNGRAD